MPSTPSSPPVATPLVRWRPLFIKTAAWLTAEIALGVIGIDHLADYGEFIAQRQPLLQVTQVVTHLVSSM